MNVHFPETDSRRYFYTWIFMIVAGWILWFFALDHIIKAKGFLFAAIFGSVIGLLSGFSPIKAFKVCFYGFCAVALLLTFGFPIVAVSQIFIGALGGLFAVVSSVFRGIALHQSIEISMRSWQWALLIGGGILFADIFVLLGMLQEVFVFHHFDYLYQYLIPMMLGLFSIGVFVGTFSDLEKDDLMKSLRKLIMGCHGFFLLCVLLIFIIAGIEWNLVLLLPLTVLFSALVLGGTKVGFNFRNSEIIKHSGSDFSNSE
jgi:hypothetical protein